MRRTGQVRRQREQSSPAAQTDKSRAMYLERRGQERRELEIRRITNPRPLRHEHLSSTSVGEEQHELPSSLLTRSSQIDHILLLLPKFCACHPCQCPGFLSLCAIDSIL